MIKQDITLTNEDSKTIKAIVAKNYNLTNQDKVDKTLDTDLELTLLARETAVYVNDKHGINENSFILVLLPHNSTFLKISVGLIKTGDSGNRLTYGVMHK